MPARHLTHYQKLRLLKTISQTGTVALSCRNAGIPRSTYYLWLKSLGNNSSKAIKAPERIKPDYRGNFSYISQDIARKVIKIALTEPDYSIRKIASSLGVSTGYVWKKLREKNLTTRIERLRYRNLRGNRIYPEIEESTKFNVIYKYKNGLSVNSISRSVGVSRTTIYKWLDIYAKSKEDMEVLRSKRPKSERHWNYKKGVEQILLDKIALNPNISLDELLVYVNQYSTFSMSRSGVYNILRKLKLNRVGDRIKYASSRPPISNQNAQSPIINKIDSSIQSKYPYLKDLPIISSRLLVYLSSVSLVSILILLSWVYIPSAVMPRSLNPLLTINKDALSTERGGDNYTRLDWKKPKPLYSSIENDFNNGVFISNTNKNFYKRGESAKFSFGVLNGAGTTICDSDISLEITSPDNQKTALSTLDGGVSLNPECHGNSFVKAPDYTAEIKTDKPGLYKIKAVSKSGSGTRRLDDAFYVESRVPFDIDRAEFPTRVYPVDEYYVSLSIKPEEDFTGEITEALPSGFRVSSTSADLKIAEDNGQLLTWKVDWKKDKVYKLSYVVKFPENSPAVYTIKPLTITSGDSVIFEEIKSWKISIDTVN